MAREQLCFGGEPKACLSGVYTNIWWSRQRQKIAARKTMHSFSNKSRSRMSKVTFSGAHARERSRTVVVRFLSEELVASQIDSGLIINVRLVVAFIVARTGLCGGESTTNRSEGADRTEGWGCAEEDDGHSHKTKSPNIPIKSAQQQLPPLVN